MTGGAEAEHLKAYRYNTSYWSFAPAIDIYRDLAHADEAVVGPAAVVSARIYLAFNLATVARFDEAQAALDQAEILVGQFGERLSPLDERMLRVNLLIGRAVLAGNRGGRADDAERAAAFQTAVALADQAAALSREPLRQAAAEAHTAGQGEGGVILEASATQRYNQANAAQGPALLIGRRMTPSEKLAELEARSHYAAGAAQIALGDDARAAEENQAARRALVEVDADMASWLRGLVEAQASDLQLRAGDVPGAQRTLMRAIAQVRRAHGLSRPEAYLLRRNADLQARMGDMAGAKTSQEKSFAILIDQTDGTQPTRREVAPYLALLAPGALAGDSADISRFFAVASVATETATASTVANVAERFAQGDSASAAAIRDLQSARVELDRATARLTRVNEPASGATPQQLQGAEDLERAARQRVAETLEQARKAAGPRAAAVISPKTELADLQSVLAPDEAYVRFIFLDDGAGYAVLVRKGDAHVVRLAVNEADAARKVADLRASTQVTAQGAVPGYRLTRSAEVYQDLFGALDPALQDVRRLVIEPSGPLFSLQFAALLTQPADADLKARFIASRGIDYSHASWLARSKVLETSVGSAAFVRLRQVKASSAPNPIFAFADPTPQGDNLQAAAQLSGERSLPGITKISTGNGACIAEARAILGFEPLPDSLSEARSAVSAFGSDTSAAVMAGQAFTDTAVTARSDLKSYRVLLFATHAALPSSNRCWPDPFLITTKAEGALSDGVLDTMEIGGLNLDANLVVLSACDTAAGDTNGQALGGLAQSFFFAGSRAVLVSHWAVNSRATAALITGVLAAEAKGATPGQALTQAEQTLMDDPALSHPYYWAAFALVGGTGR
ncbi:MAG TPA: CHAT domain-containing protein [Caulobacteraceae bacterium]